MRIMAITTSQEEKSFTFTTELETVQQKFLKIIFNTSEQIRRSEML